jgi:hypothetical protein
MNECQEQFQLNITNLIQINIFVGTKFLYYAVIKKTDDVPSELYGQLTKINYSHKFIYRFEIPDLIQIRSSFRTCIHFMFFMLKMH